MRIVHSADQFDEALRSCRREAMSAFGDDRVLIERYLQGPRHIEIQVFADRHGQCLHLFERDCSVQRRHQKVVEEAPAPGMTDARRSAMGEAAVAAARAVGYEGAGTVEFIVEPDGRFYFMEMNTRLQVEHPVTEMITGQDLVEWQLRVAAGERLPCSQQALAISGHAIEVRLYAEQPERGFLPSIGRIDHLRLPAANPFALTSGDGARAAVRLDGGVRAGDTITPHYDPMIAKLICWGENRTQAIARMRQALAQVELVGPASNAAFLLRLMGCPSFVDGPLDTGLIERERSVLLPEAATSADRRLRAIAACALLGRGSASRDARATRLWSDPWSDGSGWRLHGLARQSLRLIEGTSSLQLSFELAIEYQGDGRFRVVDETGGQTVELAPAAEPAGSLRGWIDGRAFTLTAVWRDDALHLFEAGDQYRFALEAPGRTHAAQAGAAGSFTLTAPMPGKVIELKVAEGDRVGSGQLLMVLEAMKMEHPIHAPQAGQVQRLAVLAGDQVAEAMVLLVIGPVETDSAGSTAVDARAPAAARVGTPAGASGPMSSGGSQ
jgi:3-methylcrotonyl-CoA carboxylase alpha subunit